MSGAISCFLPPHRRLHDQLRVFADGGWMAQSGTVNSLFTLSPRPLDSASGCDVRGSAIARK
jgi:hypothetical protein